MAREMLPAIENAIAAKKDALAAVAKEIYDNPEVGLKEFNSARVQCEYLSGMGLDVTRNFGGRETAFRADFRESRTGRRRRFRYRGYPYEPRIRARQ